MGDLESAAIEGARNLLENCVDVVAGQTLLLIEEDAGIDYFDGAVGQIVAQQARELGATVLTIATPRAAGPDGVPVALMAAMEHVDHTIFLNRIGDQMRFRSLPGSGTKTMVYTLDVATLASKAAAFDHGFMTEMVALFNNAIDDKRKWRITCAAGTDVQGMLPPPEPVDAAGGFAVRLFPMSVYRPLPADTMSGQIVLERWVSGTNTHVYSPEAHHLDSPIIVHVESGRAVGFEGDPAEVDAFRAHGRMVAKQFGIDETQIHSWHSGMNPGTGYARVAQDDPVRWNGMIFGSPRYLHFHTCGDYPPGEISWHVLDPTVSFDDETFVDAGEVTFFEQESARKLLRKFDLTPADMGTNQNIGL